MAMNLSGIYYYSFMKNFGNKDVLKQVLGVNQISAA